MFNHLLRKTTMPKLIRPALVHAIAAAAIFALAQSADAAPGARQSIDTDKNGSISREEAAKNPKLAARFDAIDTNKDGVLSADERKTERSTHAAGHFAKMDTDGSKTISRAEAAQRPKLAQNFDAIDANKDGQLSPDELQAAREKMAKKTAEKR
jgi:hypothetical protein